MTKTEKRIQDLETRFAVHIKAFNEYCQFLGSEIERLETGNRSPLSSPLPADPPPSLAAAIMATGKGEVFTCPKNVTTSV